MKNYITIKQTDPKTGNTMDKNIYELKKEEFKNYKLIGSGAGISLSYCFYLGNKYTKNFSERVYGYYIKNQQDELAKAIDDAYKENNLKKARTISVSFFELP